MPTNANTFNSRVTSEALEAKFRQVFPAQGGAELVQDLFASGVIQPVVDFSTVAEGSVLAPNLQTAWDFSTGNQIASNGTATLITNPGFWQIDLTYTYRFSAQNPVTGRVYLDTGLSQATIWRISAADGTDTSVGVDSNRFVVFVRSGETVYATTDSANADLCCWYRQIADVNGTLVNPLGFTFS